MELTDAVRLEAGQLDRLIDDCLGIMLDAGKLDNYIQISACCEEFDVYYQMLRTQGVSRNTLDVYHSVFKATLYEALFIQD